jgi:hypothetical protein
VYLLKALLAICGFAVAVILVFRLQKLLSETSNGQPSRSVPRLAWIGVGLIVLLVAASAFLFARIILGLDDRSRIWLPVTTTVTMIVVAGPTGWSIGSSLQQRDGEEE